MKVVCRHGFFKFYPRTESDLQTFMRLTGLTLVPEQDYFTFEALQGLPRYSLAAQLFGTLPATVTYEGRDASKVMRENGFVYNVTLGILVATASIFTIASLKQTTNYILVPGVLIQPGAIVSPISFFSGQRVMSYSGEINLNFQRLYIFDLGDE